MGDSTVERVEGLRGAATLVVVMFAVRRAAAQVYAEANHPSWFDEENARGNEQAARENAHAERHGEDFQIVQGSLDEAPGKSQVLRDAAEETQEVALIIRTRAGQLAAKMALGTAETTLEISFVSDGDEDHLTDANLVEQDRALLNPSTMAVQTVDAPGAQAKVAETEFTRVAAVAQRALREAAAAGTALDDQRATDHAIRRSWQRSATPHHRRAGLRARRTEAPTGSGGFGSYGMRLHPVCNFGRLHSGDDFGPSCDTPIFATAAGIVTYAGHQPEATGIRSRFSMVAG
ncbi:murein DD-endopeptidase MepM/ murein hydrolase activator NlpD [Marisediminicola sp. UYEF4]|uniref:M23 family metallopeptidase n=1 Tax=Marisediminicola sp. UYEF4 TaxID=1756384 RepID=UPI003395037C